MRSGNRDWEVLRLFAEVQRLARLHAAPDFVAGGATNVPAGCDNVHRVRAQDSMKREALDQLIRMVCRIRVEAHERDRGFQDAAAFRCRHHDAQGGQRNMYIEDLLVVQAKAPDESDRLVCHQHMVGELVAATPTRPKRVPQRRHSEATFLAQKATSRAWESHVAGSREPGVNIEQFATDLGVHPMTLTKWLRRAAVEEGAKSGAAQPEGAELREAPMRIRLLEQYVEALLRAVAYQSQANLPGNALPARDRCSALGMAAGGSRDIRSYRHRRAVRSRPPLASSRYSVFTGIRAGAAGNYASHSCVKLAPSSDAAPAGLSSSRTRARLGW